MAIAENYGQVNYFLGQILDELKGQGVDLGFTKNNSGQWNFYVKDYEAMKAFELQTGVKNWFDLTDDERNKIRDVLDKKAPDIMDRDEYACAMDLLLFAMKTPDAIRPSTKMGENDDPDDYEGKRNEPLGYTLLHLDKTISDTNKYNELSQLFTKDNFAAELEKSGIDVNFTNKDGKTLLCLAAEDGHANAVNALLANGAEVNKADNDGRISLHFAADNGHTEVVTTLLANGADVNKANNVGNTPLHWVAYSGHTEVVKTLLANRADVNKAGHDGWTPLCWAACYGHTEVVKTLLANKAEVNKADNDGNTPLHFAARHGYTEMVKTLLANGADVNKANNDGNTPLYEACSQCEKGETDADKQKYFPIIYMLEQRAEKKELHLSGELLTQYNEWKKSDAAKAYDTEQRKQQRLAQEKEQEKSAQEEAFKTAVNNGKWDAVRDLLKQHPEFATLKFEHQFNGRKRSDNTVLHIAAFAGDKATVEQILATDQGKTTLNMQNSYGSSPLHMATFNGKKEVVATLLANGAEVNQADSNKNTSLHVAVATGKKEIAETLMAHEGVNLTLKNQDNMTAHDLVIERGQQVQTAQQKKEGDATAHQAELQQLSALHQAFSEKEGTLSRYQKTTVRSYTDATKDLDAETQRVLATAQRYGATLNNLSGVEALKNKDNRSGKMTKDMQEKAKANLQKIYEAQGYPTERAELQAQIMLSKLVRANLLYHPDERVKIEGKKSQTVTELFIPQDEVHKDMTHRTILRDLAMTDVSDTQKYIAPLNNIEDAVSFSGYALQKPKDRATNRRMSYNPKKGTTAGYRTEETIVDTQSKKEASGLIARLSSAQQPKAPEKSAIERETPSQSSGVRTYSDAYKVRAETEYQSRWEQLAGSKSRVSQFKGKMTKDKKELETALSNIEKILEANGYTDEAQRKANAKIILTKLERAALDSGGKPFGFDHRQLLMDLVSGAVDQAKYPEYFKNISTVEKRVQLGSASSILKQNAQSTDKEFNQAGFKMQQKSK